MYGQADGGCQIFGTWLLVTRIRTCRRRERIWIYRTTTDLFGQDAGVDDVCSDDVPWHV